MRATTRLRQLLSSTKPLIIPGCYDALSARVLEAAGFPAVYMTGFGTAASLLGRPDVGLLGMTEMVDNARRIVGAVDIPVIADADTGYGNPISVIRTVQEYERAGLAASRYAGLGAHRASGRRRRLRFLGDVLFRPDASSCWR